MAREAEVLQISRRWRRTEVRADLTRQDADDPAAMTGTRRIGAVEPLAQALYRADP